MSKTKKQEKIVTKQGKKEREEILPVLLLYALGAHRALVFVHKGFGVLFKL